jgi:hypothetical protein
LSNGDNAEGFCDGDVVQKRKIRKHTKQKERSVLLRTFYFRAKKMAKIKRKTE